ncbi:hypothetical protein B9Z55_015119 [Caenorhabditis nigoni]|uniref:Uncharacterized protein n=1 Tax=Caenorhabditis nigoni TaxID=1611254 RepID=A0A2G5U8Z9_9PELO|nr:hypothetical protein B9Z55_015119 [Caenorhabditis nigoni]
MAGIGSEGQEDRDQRWAQYRSIIAHIQEILNLPAPVADYSELTFEEIENRFESMGVRKAEINNLYWKEVFHHSQVLFHKVDTWLGSKMVFPIEVFISAGLEDLQKFDESYAFYKEEFHLRNAHRALERVRYFNLTPEETRNRMRTVGERSAEMDRLFDAEDKRVQIDFTKKVFIGFHYVITAFIEILEGTEESGKHLKLM